MDVQITVDVERLRSQIQEKYANVAESPDEGFHFHTGYRLIEMLDYPSDMVGQLPDSAVPTLA